MFQVHGHPNVELNTCILYNVVKNTKESNNVDFQMANHIRLLLSFISCPPFMKLSIIMIFSINDTFPKYCVSCWIDM